MRDATEEPRNVLVRLPEGLPERMKQVMKDNRLDNKTAFICKAIERLCEKEEEESLTVRLEKIVTVLAENARIDRELASKRHKEIVAYLDVLAQAVTYSEEGGTEEYENFIETVKLKINT